jgi:Protein of unknown function (DUF4238)
MNRKQHYIPQSLLRKFSISPQKDQVYWYRKEKTILSSIKDVFSERDYYGKKESEYFADNVVSDGEKAIINELLPNLVKMEGLLNQRDSKKVCNFIAHFALRRSLNRNLLFTIAEEYCLENDDLSLDKILNSFKPVTLKVPSSKMLNHNYFFRIYLTPFIINSCVNFLKEILAIHAKNNNNDLKSQSRDTHNKIIIAEKNHQLVAESLSDFQWVVIKSQHCLILGDSICFFESQDGKFSPFDDDLIKNIYMPISSHKLLVGFKGIHSPAINSEQINHQNARCCHNSFVFSENSDEIQSLVNLIGENFKPVQQKVFRSNNLSVNHSILSQFSAHFAANPYAKQMLDYLRIKMNVTR